MQIRVVRTLGSFQEKHLCPKDPVYDMTQAELLCGNYFLHIQQGWVMALLKARNFGGFLRRLVELLIILQSVEQQGLSR